MKFAIFSAVFFVIFSYAYAGVVITEIMYDIEGSDAGREWVEIQNNGPSADLTGWKFFENGTNHGLVLSQGNIALPENGFAIIADNAEKFILDWPDFSGTLFDSAFSLSNTGETIILRDAGLADNDTATYSSEMGAVGDGNSLQKSDGKWVSALSTPGYEQTEPTAVNSGSVPEPKPAPFSAYAGEDRVALAGAEVYFKGQINGAEENMVEKARFLWNFGDGITNEGRNTKHVFQYPGTYIISLDASLSSFSDLDTATIVISPASIFISEIRPGPPGGGFLEIKNESSKISDVSGFTVQIDDSTAFHFPKDTMLSPNSFLTLDILTLGFKILDKGEVKILYPNGKILFSSKYESGILKENESINFDGKVWLRGISTPGAKNSIKKEPASAAADASNVGIQNNQNIELSKNIFSSNQNNPKDASKEASVIESQINASMWSEIKWLIFGIGIGVVAGLAYLFLKRHFKPVSAL